MEMSKENFKKWMTWFFRSFIWLFVLLFIIDLVTKQIVMYNIDEGNCITIIPGFLSFTYLRNDKAAFSMGFGDKNIDRWTFVIIATIGAIIIITYYVKRFNKISQFVKACLMLLLTGAVGNLVDRLFYSHSDFCVVDWINFFNDNENFNKIWHYPFNIADAAVCIGAIMLIVYLIVTEVEDYKKARALEAASGEGNGKILSKEEKERLNVSENSEPEAIENEEKPSENEEN